MFDYKDYLVRQEQRKSYLVESEKEQLLRLAAREANKKDRKREKDLERQPARQETHGLVLQLRRLMSFLL